MRGRKTRWISLGLALCMVLSLLPAMSVSAAAAEVISQEQLHTALENNEDISLTGNIQLTGTWTPVSSYSGTLSGNGHTISCLQISSGDDEQGLVQTLNAGGKIEDLTIIGSVVSSYASNAGRVGAFAGVNYGTIEDCVFYGSVSQNQGDNQAVGGIAGLNEGTVLRCANYGDISAISTGGSYDAVYVGGIAGSNHGDIESCTNHGLIFGAAENSNTYVGQVWGSTAWQSNGGYVGGIAGDTNSANDSNANHGAVLGVDSSENLSFESVVPPTGITFPTPPATAEELQAKLPSYVLLNTTGGAQAAGRVTWDVSGYDSSASDATYTFTGNVTLPTYVTASGDITASITVTIGQGGTLPHNHPVCGASCPGHDSTHENVTWTAWDGSSSLIGGSYYLTSNIQATGDISISGDVNLCLNGYVLDLNGHHIKVKDSASLTLCDCSDTGGGGTGKITGQNNTHGNEEGKGSVYVSGGSFTMYSGSITDNNTYSGGGVYVVASGSFTMHGGSISGNTTTAGGGVYVSGGTFTMHGGSISGNTATGNGGGVFVSGGSFTMSGGSITGNETQNSGGGVYVVGSGAFTLSGAPTITGNTKNSAANNVYLSNSCVITIGGALTGGGKIGVTMRTPGEFTKDWGNIMDDAAPADYFTCENSGYLVERTSGGEAMLHKHTYTYGGSGTVITETCAACGHIETATISVPANADLTYTGSAVTPAEVQYSNGWLGGELTPAYENNTDVGTATAKITKGNATAKVTFEITRAAQTKPASDEGYVIDYAAEAITVESGYEVYTDTSATMPVESGGKVVPGTTYYIRKAGTDTYSPSDFTAITVTARPATPAAPTVTDRTDTSITISIAPGCEYSIDGASWVSGTDSYTFETLTPGTAYTIYVRVAATASAPVSESASAAVTTKTAPAESPAAPGGDGSGSAITVTDGSIIVTGSVSGQEYIVLPKGETPDESDWTSAQSGNGENLTFDGLTHGTEYTVWTRDKETDSAMPSQPSQSGVTTAAKTPDSYADGMSIDYTEEAITVNPGYEISTDGQNWSESAEFTPGETYYVRVQEQDGVPASASVSFTAPQRPEQPGEAVTVTGESIRDKGDGKIDVPSGMEYSTDGGTTWAAGPKTLENLEADTTVVVRVKATATAPHGVEQSYTVPASTTTLTVTFDENDGSDVDDITGLSYGVIVAEPETSRAGYTLDGWYTDSGAKWNFGTQITENVTLTAKWTLNAPTVTLTADKESATYDGGKTVITLTAAATHDAGVSYTCEWFRDGQLLPGETDARLTLTDVKESGSYTVKVTVRDQDNRTAEKTSDTVTVTIGKANPVTTWPTASAITYGQSLGESTLTGGSAVSGDFSWDNGDIYPRVSDSNTTAYTVVFTPTDGANYNTVRQSLTVTVNKATLTPEVASVQSKIYDGNTDTKGTIRLTGAVGSEKPTASGVFSFENASAGTGKTVTVAVTLDGDWGDNYKLSTGELTSEADIGKATVGLTWRGYEKLVYDGEAVSVTAQATGLVNGDTCTVTVSGGAEIDAGNYTARATGLENPNYQLPGTGTTQAYTIAPRPVTLTWSGDSFTYDGQPHTVTAAIDNLVSGDTCELTYKDNEKTDSDSYTAKVTALGNANYTLTGGTGLTHQWIIGKKSITGTWQGLSQVYDGQPKTVSILLEGLAGGDGAGDIHYHYTGTTDGGNVYDSATPPAEAGTYTVTASSDNYEITNGTAVLEILKKSATVTVTDNAVTIGGEPQVTVPGLTGDDDYTVTYKDNQGNVVNSPTQPGSYQIWVTFTNPNYRHPDGSTSKQVGTFTVAEQKPAAYTVAFDGNGETSGNMAGLELVGGSLLTLPECGYTRDGFQFTGWLYNGKIYQPGGSFTTAYGHMTFTAQWQAVFEVSGTVKEQTNDPNSTSMVENAVVSLWLGATKINETSTDANGAYRFANLIPGIYNLVVSKDARTVTRMVEITTEDRSCDAVLPEHITNSIVEVTPGSPDIVVGNLDNAFTEADLEKAKDNSKVEITFSAEEKDAQDAALAEDLEKLKTVAGGSSVGLVMDYTLTKVVTNADGSEEAPETVPVASVLLKIRLPLPTELQGKYGYTVSRIHEGKAQTLSTTPNDLGEYFEVSGDKTVLTLHVCCFSTYAVGYRNAPSSSSSTSYPPVKEESENGSYTITPGHPATGQTVTITPVPAEGYTVDQVIVVDRNGETVAVIPEADGTYTFTQPDGSVTVTVTFRERTSVFDCPRDDTCPMADFTDADRNAWYHDGVHYCVEHGLMSGYGNGIFGPDNSLSRGMLVQILYNLEDLPATSGEGIFEDVADGAWYSDAVNWAASMGIVGGYGNGVYGPDDSITREQLAAILYRYAQYKEYDVSVGNDTNLLSYTDASKISEYAIPAMQWAYGAGIISGVTASALVPEGTATRVQAATMLMQFADKAAQ